MARSYKAFLGFEVFDFATLVIVDRDYLATCNGCGVAIRDVVRRIKGDAALEEVFGLPLRRFRAIPMTATRWKPSSPKSRRGSASAYRASSRTVDTVDTVVQRAAKGVLHGRLRTRRAPLSGAAAPASTYAIPLEGRRSQRQARLFQPIG